MAPGRDVVTCPAAGAWTTFGAPAADSTAVSATAEPAGAASAAGAASGAGAASAGAASAAAVSARRSLHRWRGGLAGGNPPASDWFASSSAATEGAPADATCVPASSVAAAGVAASSAKAGSGSAASSLLPGTAPADGRLRLRGVGTCGRCVRIRHRPLHARSLGRRCLFRRSGRRWPWERLSAWSSWPSSARRRHLWRCFIVNS